jgi:hypothetical protein
MCVHTKLLSNRLRFEGYMPSHTDIPIYFELHRLDWYSILQGVCEGGCACACACVYGGGGGGVGRVRVRAHVCLCDETCIYTIGTVYITGI